MKECEKNMDKVRCASQKIIPEILEGEQVEVVYDPLPVFPGSQHPGVRRETVLLEKGTRYRENSAPLACDMILDKDVPIELRDGIVVFADVIRPVGEEPVPAILAYSPYGKHIDSLHLPWGVRDDTLSGLQKQEGPDPGFWVPRGYAVVQPDARGVYYCGGENRSFGSSEARDGYDMVEWTAAQSWCSGKVGMSGNSYLAVAQFLVASLNPPHLAAIAPWEGFNDVYRQTSFCGGIPDFGFQEKVDSGKQGFGWYENLSAMARKYPRMNGYWADKRTKLEQITVPAYIVASYVSNFHTYGTPESYQRIASKEKWLRIHNTHEWADLYEYQEDLCKFFDCFLKGKDNDWRMTPPVRLSVLNPGGEDVVNRIEQDYPLPDAVETNFYLDNETGKLTLEPPKEAKKQAYVTDDRKSELVYTWRFQERTEICGYVGVHLWVETEVSDDLDVFVYALKSDDEGRLMPPVVYGAPFSGFEGAKLYTPCGRLRASLRELDPGQSTETKPFHTFRNSETLAPGVPVRIDIPLRPIGMVYEKGQALTLIVSGFEKNKPEWPDMEPAPTVNKGNAFIFSGGERASYVTVPLVHREREDEKNEPF